MFLKEICVLPLWLKKWTPRKWKFPQDSLAGRGNSAAAGASREDAVSRTTPHQTTSQGAEPVMHSDISALGCLAVCVLLPTQTLPSGQAPESGLWRPCRLCLLLFPTWLHWQKSLFSAFCYYFGSIHWLSEDRWLDLACWGYRAYGSWDQHKVHRHVQYVP